MKMIKKTIIVIILCVIALLVVLLLNRKVYEPTNYNKNPIDSNDFTISDISDYNEYEEVYSKDGIIYKVTNPNRRYIILKDNQKVLLKDALSKNMVTVDQVKEKGLMIVKQVKDSDKALKEIKYISVNELVNMINSKKSFIIVIAQEGCHNCKVYLPKIASLAKANNITIYAIDISNISKSEKDKVVNLLSLTGTPTTYFFENGKVNDNIMGNVSTSIIIKKLIERGYIK